MKLKLAAATVAVMLSQGALAQGQPPQACPDVAQLQAVGVSMPWQDQQTQGQWWGIAPSATFGTSDNWTFGAGPIESQSQQGVLEAINQKIATLTLAMGPIPVEVNDVPAFACLYVNQANDFNGVTITPPMDLGGAVKFMHQVRRK